MKMTFVRSGGFAGPMTRVEGSVDFNGEKATVTSASRGYRRELEAGEARDLRKAADPASWPAASKDSGPSRDSFQYDVTVTTDDGSMRKTTFYDQPSTPLTEWIKQESDRIFSHK